MLAQIYILSLIFFEKNIENKAYQNNLKSKMFKKLEIQLIKYKKDWIIKFDLIIKCKNKLTCQLLTCFAKKKDI